MKRQAKKSYINISELVSAFNKENSAAKVSKQICSKENSNRKEENNKENNSYKENRSTNTRPSSQNSSYDITKVPNQQIDMLSKTLKIEKRALHRNEESIQPVGQRKNSRVSIYEQLSKKRVLEHPIKDKQGPGKPKIPKHMDKLQMLQNLIVSEKMFIDPDKWDTFLSKSQNDEKFHRALSAFLYSYFIQNYQ